MFVCGRLIRRNERICDSKYMLGLLSRHVCRANVTKHSEYFWRILGVKPSRFLDIHSQNPPKIFGMFRKVSAAYMVGWKVGLTCVSSHIFFISSNQYPPHKRGRSASLKHTRQRQRTYFGNHTRYTLTSF